MAWPCLKTTVFTPDRQKAAGLSGCFYVTRGEQVDNFCQLQTEERKAILLRLEGFKDLKPDILDKLSVMSESGLTRLEEVWRSIEDCLLLSTPELFATGGVIPRWIWRLWKWCMSYGTHSVDAVTSTWKKFSLHLIQVNGEHPWEVCNIPSHFPWTNKGGLARAWFRHLPWLGLSRLSSSKEWQMRLSHLTSTRNFPSPALTPKRCRDERASFKERLTRKIPIEPVLVEACEELGRRFSRFVKGSDVMSNAHLSLSATASFDRPRNQGGRVRDFLQGFCKHYVQDCATETVSAVTWFGSPYKLEEGVPPCFTMCRAVPLKKFEGKVKFLESNFETPFLTPFDPGYKIEEPIFGLDVATGYQFLQYSIEEGLREGILFGLPYEMQGLQFGVKRNPIVRTEMIGEPGNKVRTITVAQSWQTVLLQPLEHELAPIISAHPALTSGFLRSWKGWDFACNLNRRNIAIPEDFYLMFYDLEAASDNMCLEYVRALLHGLLDGAGRNGKFLHFLVDLLCHPHDIYRSVRGLGVYWFTSSFGLLMGHPGTKVAVSANFLLAHELAVCIHYARTDIKSFLHQPRPSFTEIAESAGDDAVIGGSLEFCEISLQTHVLIGNRINYDKPLISKRSGKYCEEPLIFRDHVTNTGQVNLLAVPYERHIHVDAIKIRLLSPYGKVTANEPESYLNPAIGKAQALQNKLAWLPAEWTSLKIPIQRRWYFRMRRYVHWNQALSYVPSHFGGAGMPVLPEMYHVVLELLQFDGYVSACLQVLDGIADGFVRRLMHALSTGGEIRGIEFDIREQAHEQYVMSASLVDKMRTLDQIASEAGLRAEEVRSLPRPKKRIIAKRLGYIAEFDLNLRIEKLWVVKQAIQEAMNLRPMSVAKPVNYDEGFKAFRYALKEFPRHSVNQRIVTIADRERLFRAILNNERPRTGEERFVHKDILSLNFSLLETPLPGNPCEDRAHVRGSVADNL